MSKGSKPRPMTVSEQEYASRWDAIFNREPEDVKTEDADKKEETDENINLA